MNTYCSQGKKVSVFILSLSLFLAPSPLSQNFVTTMTQPFIIQMGTLFSCLGFFPIFKLKYNLYTVKFTPLTKFCNFGTCIPSCDHHQHNQNTEDAWAPKSPQSPFVHQSFPAWSPVPGNQWSGSCSYDFAFSRMLFKCN